MHWALKQGNLMTTVDKWSYHLCHPCLSVTVEDLQQINYNRDENQPENVYTELQLRCQLIPTLHGGNMHSFEFSDLTQNGQIHGITKYDFQISII